MKPVIPLTLPDSEEGGADTRQVSAAETRFAEILERYGTFLRRTIARLCPPLLKSDLDDLEQEARIRLWQVLQNEREIVYPGSYIYKVACSVTIRAIRRAQARKEEELPADSDGATTEHTIFKTDPASSPEALAERRQWLERIDRARMRLSDDRSLAVGLHLQGLSTTEIADVLGWSEPRARNLVHRGLKDLRRHLASGGIEQEQ